MSGFLTNQRLWGATTLINHVSDYVHVQLMRDLSLTKTFLAKSEMEKVMAQAGRTAKHYHTNNDRFADNGCIDAINGKDQNITFCGVGAHHQNGIIENKNKTITTGGRTLLIHSRRMLPNKIDEMFWPFAIKSVAERLNSLQVDLTGQTPESILHDVEIEDIRLVTTPTPVVLPTRTAPPKNRVSRGLIL